jgi:hypothetical protein
MEELATTTPMTANADVGNNNPPTTINTNAGGQHCQPGQDEHQRQRRQ